MRRVLLPAITVVIILAQAAFSYAGTNTASYKDGDVISSDTLWSGRVEVEGVILVPEGVTLTITPGTVIAFSKSSAQYKEDGGEGSASEALIPGSGIRVEGKVIAAGDKGKEITFTSAEANPSPGSWGCVFLDHSKGSIFKYCRFEYSAYTIHAHFSQFDVSRCTITNNEDGSRIGYSRASFDHCDIRDNSGKGLNFYQSRNTVRHCNITGNRDGIFLNAKDSACTISDNNIHGNTGMDLRLGDFHAEDVDLKGNWWGNADPAVIAKKVWDRDDDPNIGRAVIEPAKAEIINAGVDGVELQVKWKFKTGGFVDCNPAVENGIVYFGSWDKKFYAVKTDTGEQVWSFQTGDCVDSSPTIADGKVYFGSWDRNIYCLDAKDGKLVWKFEMPPSNFDDHRQASPAVSGGVVYMGGFNGFLYALDTSNGKKLWELKTGGAIRSKSFLDGPISGSEGEEYTGFGYVGAEDGILYTFDIRGEIHFKFVTGSSIKSLTGGKTKNYTLYFGARDGNLYSVRIPKEIWRYSTGSRIEYSSPLVINNPLSSPLGVRRQGEGANDLVLIGDCSGTLHAVNKETGMLVWKFTGGGGIYSSPQAVKDRVVYGDNAGNVYCLDTKTGRPLGEFRAGDAVQGLSTGPDGTIYAGSRDGYLYALSLGH